MVIHGPPRRRPSRKGLSTQLRPIQPHLSNQLTIRIDGGHTTESVGADQGVGEAFHSGQGTVEEDHRALCRRACEGCVILQATRGARANPSWQVSVRREAI